MNTKTIAQLAVFEAPARRVYDALLDSKKHSEFTGDAASIDARPVGHFKAYGDYISGVFLEIVPGKKIVQEWQASDWPPGTSYKVTIQLQEQNGLTTLRLTQDGVPEAFAEEISQGWHDFYWDRLREYVEKA